MSRGRRVLQVVVVVLALPVVLGGWLEWSAQRRWDAPYPPISADVRPEALARGEKIFEAKCAGCHREDGAVRAAGRRMADVPPALGEFHAANLTRDPQAGIGGLRDEEIARAVRSGVTRDGRRSIMGWALSDADLAAVIGYLRSPSPTFEADPTVQPPTRYTLLGKAVVALVLGPPRALPASGLTAPPSSSGAPYGEYLAKEVYDCGACHTSGFATDKADGPEAFRGGMELLGADGATLSSPNLTFHATGLLGWSQAELGRALRDGLGRDGQPLRSPMPRFHALDDGEVRALYLFLQALPPGPSLAPARPRPPGPPARSEAEALFLEKGCGSCHAPGLPLDEKLTRARGRDVAELARWIRDAQAMRPGSAMPSFRTVLSPEQAELLARWISAGRPRGEVTAHR